jgi:cytochrome b6-f complex iron-sulfur subunit
MNRRGDVGSERPDAERAETAGTTRRGLVGWLWRALGLAAIAEAGWIAASFVRPRARGAGERVENYAAGPESDFVPGSVTAFPAGKFYLVRLADGGFLALYRECTHLGCSVPWREETNRFECPCHASTFDITGAVLGPPAPRPLDLLPVRLENGVVKVELGRRIRRARFEPSQVARS